VSVWALLWKLVVHVLHGRGRDQVHVVVNLPGDQDPASGPLERFTWQGDRDAFCELLATDNSERSVA
jgi:hypothetical protein